MNVESFLNEIESDFRKRCEAIVKAIEEDPDLESEDERRLVVHGTLTQIANQLIEKMGKHLSVATASALSSRLYGVVRSYFSEH